jgi:hypothetical protein
MRNTSFAFSVIVFCLIIGACSASNTVRTNIDCPITLPPTLPFELPEGYQGSNSEPNSDMFWFGTAELWVMLRDNGVWSQLPKQDVGFVQKLVWWSQDYDWLQEQVPDFQLYGQRIDGVSAEFESDLATNAYTNERGSMIMTGVVIPSTGCWQITGEYNEAELSFVVEVRP